MSVINQKEYLKKYLGLGKKPGEKKKKRKKEKKPQVDRLKIIDDDIDVTISQEIQDLTAENEDAPQVVAVIDERPLHLQVDEQTNRKLWEPIGRGGQSSGWVQVDEKTKESPETDRSGSERGKREESLSPPRKTRNSSPSTSRYNENSSPDRNWIRKERRSLSPSRNDRNLSPPPRKYAENNYDSVSRKKHTRKPSQEDLLVDRKLVMERKNCTRTDLSPNLSPRNRDSSLGRGDSDSKRIDVDDLSPVRKRIKKEKTTSPPPRHKDLSPPRRKDSSQLLEDFSPPQKRSSVDDVSPVRKHHRSLSRRNRDSSLRRGDSDSKQIDIDDLSPVRRRIKKENTTSPPPRHKDLSPPRKKDSSQRLEDFSPQKKHSGIDDLSPVRKRRSMSPRKRDLSIRKDNFDSKRTEDLSPIRRRIKKENTTSPPPKNKDLSPPRRKVSSHSRSFEDLSPVRRHIKKEKMTSPPPRTRDSSQVHSYDSSPVRNEFKRERSSSSAGTSSSSREKKKHDDRPKQKRSRWKDRSPDPEQSRTTLSGKKAGLQNARELIEEIEAAKRREDEVFRNLTEEQSGRNATTVVRNQKPVDPEEEARKIEKEREIKERYNRWGKGLKQVEDDNQKLADELYEMTKPLARYADDEDLERYLKEQEREGDPMLSYIRKKKKKKVIEDGIPEKPTYMGEFMPNRFGIRPGYRWDGVDRSNGYEKKYFEVQNARKAVQEDAFKWSTEDM